MTYWPFSPSKKRPGIGLEQGGERVDIKIGRNGQRDDAVKTPDVSICIPAYQQPECLKRALASVLQQDFTAYEVILTDDSRDNSVENVVKEFQTKGARITYSRNSSRLGSPRNWNEAIRRSSGKYIKILHHDDWLASPNSLGRFVHALETNPQALLAFSSTRICRPDMSLERVHLPQKDRLSAIRQDFMRLLEGNIIGAPSATIYRRSFDQDFESRMKWVVDVDFYMRILKECNEIAFIDEPLVCTINGAPHQVTQECANNPNVEIFEYFCLYDKNRHTFFPQSYEWGFLAQLLKRFSIRSLNHLGHLDLSLRSKHIIRIITMAQRAGIDIGKPATIGRQRSTFGVRRLVRLVAALQKSPKGPGCYSGGPMHHRRLTGVVAVTLTGLEASRLT